MRSFRAMGQPEPFKFKAQATVIDAVSFLQIANEGGFHEEWNANTDITPILLIPI